MSAIPKKIRILNTCSINNHKELKRKMDLCKSRELLRDLPFLLSLMFYLYTTSKQCLNFSLVHCLDPLTSTLQRKDSGTFPLLEELF